MNDKNISDFNKNFNKVAGAADNIAGVFGTIEGEQYSSEVQRAINSAVDVLNTEGDRTINSTVDSTKGFLAEQWHSETLKISGAARSRDDVKAHVPGGNEPGRDLEFGDAKSSHIAEVKYWKTPEDTAKQISRPEYTGNEKIVPSDQLEDVKQRALEQAERNADIRPEQAKNYQHTADTVKDHAEVGNASSRPISEVDMREMAKDHKTTGEIDGDKFGLLSENFVEWTDAAREAGEAGLHAAALSAAIKAAPHIWALLQEYLENGNIKPEDLREHTREILSGSASAGLRGGVAACLTITCKTGLMGEALKSVSPVAIGMATTMTINAISYSIQFQQGQISQKELAEKCLRDAFVLSAGFCGASLGQLIIPIPMVGALVGNIVGSMVAAVCYEGANQVILGVCINTGWTLLGLVEQDYVVPEEVLHQTGCDMFLPEMFSPEQFTYEQFQPQGFAAEGLLFTPVRRGVIAFRSVGYVA
ncbi:hypothetical protein [Alcanivorax sp. 1008]|uniref:hypothetical protein n=1 Tax=Alcanivorax sp. 1008 TaxID=2816853 RepID=UPI001D468F9F|nr:hypothetical protein [Alcanivorax sp. 1008]MCC1497934.1 hypothetical protein [Alcanivorax sp. 1008]